VPKSIGDVYGYMGWPNRDVFDPSGYEWKPGTIWYDWPYFSTHTDSFGGDLIDTIYDLFTFPHSVPNSTAANEFGDWWYGSRYKWHNPGDYEGGDCSTADIAIDYVGDSFGTIDDYTHTWWYDGDTGTFDSFTFEDVERVIGTNYTPFISIGTNVNPPPAILHAYTVVGYDAGQFLYALDGRLPLENNYPIWIDLESEECTWHLQWLSYDWPTGIDDDDPSPIPFLAQVDDYPKTGKIKLTIDVNSYFGEGSFMELYSVREDESALLTEKPLPVGESGDSVVLDRPRVKPNEYKLLVTVPGDGNYVFALRKGMCICTNYYE